jgi:inner membrane protein
MAQRITHIIFALALSYYVFGNVKFWPDILLLEFSSSIGAMLPDLDIKFGHRTLLHNIFVPLFTFISLTFTLKQFFGTPNSFIISVSYLIGFLSHILLDLFTGGVSLFYPIACKRFTLFKIKYDNPIFNFMIIFLALILSYLKIKATF